MSLLDFLNALAIEYGISTEHMALICERLGVDLATLMKHPFNELTLEGLTGQQPSL